jgi:hypothetical protein
MCDLPEGCAEDNRWRKTFIPTYIWFVAQQDDPWAVSDVAAKAGLQKIWNVVYPDIKYKIRTDGPVFALVSTTPTPQKPTRQTPQQAQQRVSDSWRSIIGLTGLTVANSFFESKEELTDEGRKKIAQEGLMYNRFLYSNASSDSPLVSLFHVVMW